MLDSLTVTDAHTSNIIALVIVGTLCACTVLALVAGIVYVLLYPHAEAPAWLVAIVSTGVGGSLLGLGHHAGSTTSVAATQAGAAQLATAAEAVGKVTAP